VTALLLALAFLTPGNITIESTYPLVPGVAWTREAVAGFFTQANPFGLEPCTITATKVADGYAIDGGGRIADGQRLIGCIPGTKTPIFQ